MPVDQAEELFVHVGLHVLAVRRVEPCDFSSPASRPHLFGLMLVVGGIPDVTCKPALSQRCHCKAALPDQIQLDHGTEL